jgi:hypothetical protein
MPQFETAAALPPPWATVGRKVRSKTNPNAWGIVEKVRDGEVVLHGGFGPRFVPINVLRVAWEPGNSTDHSIEQTKGAVLHELRSSGPLGLYLSELEHRIGGTQVPEALVELCAEGRVQWPDSLMRAVLTAAQREIDAMREEIDTLRNARDVMAEDYLDATRAFHDANVKAERRLCLLDDTVEARDNAICERDEARREVACLQEQIGYYDRIIEAQNRVTDALSCPVHGRCTPGALEEIARLRRLEAESIGANALHAVALAVNTHTTRRAIGAALTILAGAFSKDSAYARGLQDAAYVASYGPIDSPLYVVRVLLQDGTWIRTLLLGDLRMIGIERGPFAPHRFVLGSSEHGRILANEDGTIAGSPARIHPDDLAVLQSYGARDQHARDDAAVASSCQHQKSDSVVGEVGCA